MKDLKLCKQLAASAGMTAANWYVIEAEEIKALPIETLRRIEEVLGVDFGVEFDGEPYDAEHTLGHRTLTTGAAS